MVSTILANLEGCQQRVLAGRLPRTSTATRRDYDFKRPSLLLEGTFTAEFTPPLEDYRYPVEMDSLARGKVLARQALERHRSDYQLVEGESDQPTLRSGHFFTLTEHPRKTCNDLWLLLSVTHCTRAYCCCTAEQRPPLQTAVHPRKGCDPPVRKPQVPAALRA
jgi:uncharacterized protein involved in type VI secretion and phage assembly